MLNEIKYNWKLLCYSIPEAYFLQVYCKVNSELVLSVNILNQYSATLYETIYKIMTQVKKVSRE